jgi:hypothetical protein
VKTYGFSIRSRTEPEKGGWTRKPDTTREEQIERARSNVKASQRKLILAERALMNALDEVSNARVVLEKLEAEVK